MDTSMTHQASDKIVNSITQWMETFVEVPHPSFGNMPPCPYARQFRLQNKIKIIEPVDAVWDCAFRTAAEWNNEFEAIVIASDKTYISHSLLSDRVRGLNRRFKHQDLVMLEDHPDDKEDIDGVCMNHGSLVLIVIQRLAQLNRFSKGLQNTKYFHKWSKENLSDVVDWRFKD